MRNNTQVTFVELDTREMKQKIMEKKSILNGTKIHIDNDLTEKVQSEWWKIAKEQKDRNRKVRIGYRKLIIEGMNTYEMKTKME